MLLQFRFKNYKSFRDDTILDLTATKISELNNHVLIQGNEKILPIAGVYGANASGKSNLIDAFRYMTRYVIKSLSYGGEKDFERNKSEFAPPTPFILDSKSLDNVSLFEVYFINSEDYSEKIYNYGFTVGKDGISEEWLNYKTKSSRNGFKKIFYRNKDNLELEGIPQKSQENLTIAIENETLILSLGAKLKIAKLKLVRDWFINNEIEDFGNPIENYARSLNIPHGFANNEQVQKSVVNYFSTFDPSIVGFKVEECDSNDEEQTKHVKIFALHNDVSSSKKIPISLRQESAGTQKMFAIYQCLHDTLNKGGVFFVDELNSRLHPLLVRVILMIFLNPELNPNKAQLVFTSHDTWQLNNNILRRDEIWFTSKDEKGISSLYSLSEIENRDGSKIRKDENFEKNYLLGKYGAIPVLKNINILGDEKDVQK